MKYKVLTEDMTSPFQNFQYETGKWYRCSDFDTDPDIACSDGFYATGIRGLPYAYNTYKRVFAVAVDGESVLYDQFKQRFEKIKLVREVPLKELVERAKEVEKDVGYKLSGVIDPCNPLEIEHGEITKGDTETLKEWGSVVDSVEGSAKHSVWDSVVDSVWNSVWGSVGDPVRHSVRASVWDSVVNSVGAPVWDSVWNSVWAYIGSLFPNIANWEYVKYEPDEYPFQPAVDLWKSGLVPSFDGESWNLHAGENAEIVFTLTGEENE